MSCLLKQDPAITFFDKMASGQSPQITNNLQILKDDENSIVILERLISNEENYYANILLKCLKLCPSLFGIQNFNELMN